jgi:hypothetical protein
MSIYPKIQIYPMIIFPKKRNPSNNIDLQKYFSYFDFGNGEYFLGEMEKETANGYGIMVYDNGDLCIGNFKEGKRNGIGLYLLYNGEWETINFEGDNYNIVSSSINYRNIDANRKANIKSSLSEAFGYFAQAANQTVQIASEVQSIKKGEKPFSNTSSNVNISENTNLSDDNISKEKKSSTVPYSISANQNKNTDQTRQNFRNALKMQIEIQGNAAMMNRNFNNSNQSNSTKDYGACPNCHGTGRCTMCAGRGEWKDNNGIYHDCSICHGGGQCPSCHGSGKLR